MQRPPVQFSPKPTHTAPHAPQFIRFVERSTHSPVHGVWPCGHTHLPFTHDSAPLQGELHWPQLKSSVCGSTHWLLHHICVGVHRDTHLPALHSLSAVHDFLHVPQFWLSLVRSTHEPLQIDAPPSHTHCPDLQCAPSGHTRVHEPQCASSLWMSTHELLHTVSPEAQRDAHLPCEHTSVVWHGAPHAPQFAGSDLRSLHVPLQSCCAVGHTHPPSLHVMVELHATPQPPQFWTLLVVSTQSPAQNVSPGCEHESVHTPCTHSAPSGHWWPQKPQFDGSLCVSVHPFAWLPEELPPPHPCVQTDAAATSAMATRIVNRTRLLGGFDMAPRLGASPVPRELGRRPGP
jgi:hypothetical protein